MYRTRLCLYYIGWCFGSKGGTEWLSFMIPTALKIQSWERRDDHVPWLLCLAMIDWRWKSFLIALRGIVSHVLGLDVLMLLESFCMNTIFTIDLLGGSANVCSCWCKRIDAEELADLGSVEFFMNVLFRQGSL